jgi:hypothetical protein
MMAFPSKISSLSLDFARERDGVRGKRLEVVSLLDATVGA